MSVKFPLNDIRKDIQGNWELELINESITVPTSGDYIVRLWEIPDKGEIESVPSINGLTLVNTYTPDPLQFAVKYSTGDVIFNQNEAGNTYTISYYGKGSLVEAADINYLYNLATSGDNVDDGILNGQMLYWDNIESKWTYVNINDLSWDTTNNILNVSAIQYDTTYDGYHNTGVLHWNPDEDCLEYDITETSAIQIGQELVQKIKNDSGSDLINGTIVYMSGSTGTNLNISLAQADVHITSRCIGVLTEDVNTNSTGRITTYGRVRNLNTSAFDEGDIIYLSPTVAGTFTNVRPFYPDFAIRIGRVISKHTSNGSIFVYPMYEVNRHTTGAILFGNGNGEIGENVNNLFWDNTLNRLGVNTNSPSASHQVIGDSRFGSEISYSEFEEDGTLKFVGDATVWDDQQVNFASLGKGVDFPTEQTYKGGKVLVFDPTQDNKIYFDVQLSHKYKLNSDIEFHVHVTVPDNNTGNIRWVFTHSWADVGGTFPTETTVITSVPILANSQDKHMLHEIAETIDGSNINGVSSILICSLMREGTNINDTYANDVYLLAADFHIQIDTTGSRQEWIK